MRRFSAYLKEGLAQQANRLVFKLCKERAQDLFFWLPILPVSILISTAFLSLLAGPLQISSIAPAAGLVSGGTLVRLELQADPWPGGFTQAQADLVAQPSCKFGAVSAVASYHVPRADSRPVITCSSPPVTAGPGPVDLTVSLNGQEWTYSGATFTYLNIPAGGFSQPLTTQQVAEAEALTSWEEYLLAATGGLQGLPKFGIAAVGPSQPGSYAIPDGKGPLP